MTFLAMLITNVSPKHSTYNTILSVVMYNIYVISADVLLNLTCMNPQKSAVTYCYMYTCLELLYNCS